MKWTVSSVTKWKRHGDYMFPLNFRVINLYYVLCHNRISLNTLSYSMNKNDMKSVICTYFISITTGPWTSPLATHQRRFVGLTGFSKSIEIQKSYTGFTLD